MNKSLTAVLCGTIALLLFSCNKEKEIAVTSVTIGQATAEMYIGETTQLSATVLPSDATNKTVSWASSKQSVATVSSTGLVTAIAEGTSTITASAGGKSGTCTVTVSKKAIVVSSVELNKTTMELTVGDSETLTATVKPDDATRKDVNWISSDSSVVSVDENGTITAVEMGQATVTATAGDCSAQCNVTVKPDVSIWHYTTTNGQAIDMAYSSLYEHVVSNTYIDNDGVVVFDQIITDISHAFHEYKTLESISIPYGLITIGEYAFWECENLRDVSLPETVSTIGDWAFSGCDNLSTIPGILALRSIDSYAFAYCKGLKQLTLPNSIENIGEGAFSFCENLESITIPETASVADGVLSHCPQLSSINAARQLIRDNVLLAIAPYGINDYIIPAGISRIAPNVFRDCENFTAISFPEGMESIGSSAFSGCSNLTSLELPSSISTIEGGAFSETAITTITIPDNVSYLGGTFYGCKELTKVVLPKNLKTLDGFNFYGCIKLTDIVIPEGVTRIGTQTFSKCGSLEIIRIPSTVADLGFSTFTFCPKLQSVIIDALTPPDGAGWFDTDTNYPIYVPAEALNTYKTADWWKDYASRIKALE